MCFPLLATLIIPQRGLTSLHLGGGASAPLPGLLLIDEIQCLYNKYADFQELFGYLKCLGAREAMEDRLQFRILAASFFGSSPSNAPNAGPSIAIPSPLDVDPKHVVGLRPKDADSLGLVLTLEEFHDLWAQVWSPDVCQLPEHELFMDSSQTKDAVFEITAGQVRHRRRKTNSSC